MSADDLPRPNKFFVRRNDFSESRSNDPQRNTSCDQRVKKRMSGDGEQESREHRSKGDVNVAQVVDVGQANRRVIATWRPKKPSNFPVCRGSRKADHDCDQTYNWSGMEKSFNRLPEQDSADDNQTYGVKDGDAPDFVEVGEVGIAMDDAMRRQRRVQLVG